ncbi:metallophosphoesterase [Flavobacterium muglaense]|nr:metallophosphoesterase [Flavobacterium muglaense]
MDSLTANAADSSKIAHTFYLIGDAGNSDEDNSKNILNQLHTKLLQANQNTTLLFLGDNIYPKGMPQKKDKELYEIAQQKLINQLQISKDFKGKTIFIPGNHDWYNGITGLERQQDFVTNYLKDKKSFLPRNACPIDDIKIDDFTTLITVDSQWFLEDWNKTPTINDNCSIKSREAFFEELESLLNKNTDKTIVLALHHPLMSNGTHGGQFSLKKQLYPLEQKIPLPIIGSLLNFIRKTSGISPQDIQNKQYNAYAKRIKTLLQGHDNVVVVSGHDHNLQYIDHDNIKQIISGAGSKSEAARAIYPNDFSYGNNGYASLTVYQNGKTTLSFFGRENNEDKMLFEQTVLFPKHKIAISYPNSFPLTTQSSIYSPEMIAKSKAHNILFGKHYRTYYGYQIAANTALLDTLYGGLKPDIAGGGHQSKSLRLVDQDGKEYVMRALKKSVSRFLQSVAFKDQYIENEFNNTYAESFLYDFYTTSHPYTPLIVGAMASKIRVSHTNPELLYIPKQNTLGQFNSNFGDELYLVEERPSKSQKKLESFGKPEDIIGTDDVLENLKKDEKYSVDENEYIKARLFDMLIGDWDRHYDQWRWGEYKKNGQIIYKPIPRDRDQAFSKYDGALLSILMNIPALRHMQSYKKDIKNVKWFNREAYPLDLALLKTATTKQWIDQAKYIQENLTEDAIDSAFTNVPNEVHDRTIIGIKKNLLARKKQLVRYAADYAAVLQKTVVIVGTDKKDKFVINRTTNNNIVVAVYRLKKDGEELISNLTYNDSITSNIWIYGLDDDDKFEVKGNAKSKIRIKLIGGQNHDNYTVENGYKVEIIDFDSKNNSFQIDPKTRKNLTDNYETNLYDYKKPKYNVFSGFPALGFNPDDGIKLGVNLNYTVNHFKQKPFTYKHSLKANYYFATTGFEVLYSLSAPKLIGDWDFKLDTQFTSPNFAMNYFGYGNQSSNTDETDGMDYNRVRIRITKANPQLTRVTKYGAIIVASAVLENIAVERTAGRFVAESNTVKSVFQNQQFAGANVKYSYENYDNPSMPTLGMGFSIAGSWKINLENGKRNFPAIESKINFNQKIDTDGKFIFATLLKGKAVLNNNYDFFQGATLGGDANLRGFRNERFLGKQSFFQSSDIRWNIGKIHESFVPMTYGIFGGFDYGRVWLDGEQSNKWHQSFGGGLWLNGLNVITARLTYFKSPDEEGRITFGLGFGF